MSNLIPKPAALNSSEFWAMSAGSGDLTQPSDATIQSGWTNSTTPPSRQYFNWLLQYNNQGVRYLLTRGIPDYDSSEVYSVGSVVIGDDGLIRASLVANNTGHTPSTSPAYWGSPQVPTAATGDNSTRIATTAFVTTAVASEASARASAVSAAQANAESYAAQQAANAQNNAESYAQSGVNNEATLRAQGDASTYSSAANYASNLFNNCSLSQSGYIKWPNGIVEQWGCLTGPKAGIGVVALYFPIAFPNACWSVVASSKHYGAGVDGSGQVQNWENAANTFIDPSGCYITCDQDADTTLRAFWRAIGY